MTTISGIIIPILRTKIEIIIPITITTIIIKGVFQLMMS